MPTRASGSRRLSHIENRRENVAQLTSNIGENSDVAAGNLQEEEEDVVKGVEGLGDTE